MLYQSTYFRPSIVVYWIDYSVYPSQSVDFLIDTSAKSIHTQYFLKVIFHMIIFDQCNTVTIIYSRAIIIAVRSDCCVKGVICKTRTGCSVGILANTAAQDQTPQNAASDQGLHCLLKLQEVRGSMQQSLLSVRDIFPSYTQRQSTHQCYQWFNLYIRSKNIRTTTRI